MSASLALLEQGGAVNIATAAQYLPNAHLQILAIRNDEIVGVDAIKRTRSDYATKTSHFSGHHIDPAMAEVGYVAVSLEHRGRHLLSRIAAALLARTGAAMFATTDKEEMKAVLGKNGFERCGRQWDGETVYLSLWIRRQQ